jgi:hypothetical protein
MKTGYDAGGGETADRHPRHRAADHQDDAWWNDRANQRGGGRHVVDRGGDGKPSSIRRELLPSRLFFRLTVDHTECYPLALNLHV